MVLRPKFKLTYFYMSIVLTRELVYPSKFLAYKLAFHLLICWQRINVLVWRPAGLSGKPSEHHRKF